MASGFEGTLGQRLLPDLLRDIALKKLTGVLRLSREEISKSITFDGGEPINAFSNIPSEQVDARLIREGRATEGLVSAAKRSQPDPNLLGSALVEQGIVPAEVMQKTASELATQIALSLFEWTEAEYHFEETEQPTCPRVLQSSLAELVTEGTRQAAASLTFLNLVAPSSRSFARSQTAGDHLAASAKLNSTEGYVFSLTSSPTRLSEIATQSGLPDEQIRVAVCVLLALGMLTAVDRSDDSQNAQIDSEDEVIRAISRKLRLFETANYYEILGVDKLATTAAINKAYQQLEAMFALHRADYADRADVQQQIKELFRKIKTAHQTLIDPLKRREYDWPSGVADNGFGQPAARQTAPPKPSSSEPIIERGQASVSSRQLPPRKPIVIPELQMPVPPRSNSPARIERGQWDGSRLAPTPPRASGPLTRPPAVLSPEDHSRLQKTTNKDQQALHFYRQGRMRFERRELEAATHLFREAVRLDPSQPHYHFYLAVVLSIQAYARHEHVHHEGCHVTCKLGGSLVRNPKVRYEAEQHFRRAAEIDPSNAQIVLKLGQLYKEAGLLKKAELYLKQSLMLDSNNAIARHELDTLYDNPEEAEDDDLDVEMR